MPTSHQHPYGTAEYWKKRSTTKQQIIDRQRAKITKLERLLDASARQDTTELHSTTPDDSELEHTPDAQRLRRQEIT